MDVDPRTPFLVERMRGFGTTIFAEMTALAQRTGAINLGQGFPDTAGPAAVLDAAVAEIRAGRNRPATWADSAPALPCWRCGRAGTDPGLRACSHHATK